MLAIDKKQIQCVYIYINEYTDSYMYEYDIYVYNYIYIDSCISVYIYAHISADILLELGQFLRTVYN